MLKRFSRHGSWFEIRALGTSTQSGWFDDPVLAAAAARTYDGKFNLYVTPNPVCPRADESVNPSSLNRARSGGVTTDADIESRRWLIIDIDHKGKGKQSATDEELAEVGVVANDIATYFSEQRWTSPMLAMSGNGYYLLSHIALPNDDPSRELIRRALHGLNFAFGSEQIAVDESVANAARLVPLFGTMKCKGEDTPDRPHRRSQIIEAGSDDILSLQMLEHLAQLGPGEGEAAPMQGDGSRLQLQELLDAAGVPYREPKQSGDVLWFPIDLAGGCPFGDASGNRGKCGVGQSADGTLLGKCFAAFHPWHEWKEVLGLRTHLENHGGLPIIEISGRRLVELSDQAWRAVLASPAGERLYRFGDLLVEVVA